MSRTLIVTCSLTPVKIREFKRMKVVRPEWLLGSVDVGYLLPWKNYIYVRKEGIEGTQGANTSQINFVGKPSDPSTALSTEFDQTGTVSVPDPFKPLPAVLQSKKPKHVQGPLYTIHPRTKADAAWCGAHLALSYFLMEKEGRAIDDDDMHCNFDYFFVPLAWSAARKSREKLWSIIRKARRMVLLALVKLMV